MVYVRYAMMQTCAILLSVLAHGCATTDRNLLKFAIMKILQTTTPVGWIIESWTEDDVHFTEINRHEIQSTDREGLP